MDNNTSAENREDSMSDIAIDDALMRRLQEEASQMRQDGKEETSLPFHDDSRIWISKSKKNLFMVLQTIDIEGTPFYIGWK